MTRRIKRLRETTKDRHLRWIKYYSENNFGIWIECVQCKKWRKNYQFSESHEVEENWCCSMNTLGMTWPAMVDEDPDVEEYFWIERNKICYHVTFLDDHVTRAWILSKNLSIFSRRPLNSQFQKKYFAAISKAEEKATIAIKMTVKERLQKFSFVHLYKGKWPTAKDSDDDDVLDITHTLLEEVDDLDSLNSFDSGILENSIMATAASSDKKNPQVTGALYDKNKSKESFSAILPQEKKQNSMGTKSNITENNLENFGTSKKINNPKRKKITSKENSSNTFKIKSKLSLKKKKPLKSPSSSLLSELNISPDKVEEEVNFTDLINCLSDDNDIDTFNQKDSLKENTVNKKFDTLKSGDTDLNDFVEPSNIQKVCDTSEKNLKLESCKSLPSDCSHKSLKISKAKIDKIVCPNESEFDIHDNTLLGSQEISSFKNTDNLGRSIEWVVNSFKVPEKCINKETTNANSETEFKMFSKNEDKENTFAKTTMKKIKKLQNNVPNEVKKVHKASGMEKNPSFKPVVPIKSKSEQSKSFENTLDSKISKNASFLPKRNPDTDKATKRKEFENLSNSNENAGNKKLKPSFQSKVKPIKASKKFLGKENFKSPLPEKTDFMQRLISPDKIDTIANSENSSYSKVTNVKENIDDIEADKNLSLDCNGSSNNLGISESVDITDLNSNDDKNLLNLNSSDNHKDLQERKSETSKIISTGIDTTSSCEKEDSEKPMVSEILSNGIENSTDKDYTDSSKDISLSSKKSEFVNVSSNDEDSKSDDFAVSSKNKNDDGFFDISLSDEELDLEKAM